LEAVVKAVSQLALSVQLPDDETFNSFKSVSNHFAVEQLKAFISSASQHANSERVKSFYLFGLASVGKSHLLHASCAYAESLGLSSLCLSFSELKQLSVELLVGLEHIDLVCLDDIQLISGDKQWQQAVFDLYNRMAEQNKYLLITGDQSVQGLSLSLADLVSRLSWGLTEQIKPLDDDEKLVALKYRAKQRGIMLTDEVIKYLLSHLSRQMGSLIEALDELDKASIREKRKITIPFIKEVLF
jgi:DnaA family protein